VTRNGLSRLRVRKVTTDEVGVKNRLLQYSVLILEDRRSNCVIEPRTISSPILRRRAKEGERARVSNIHGVSPRVVPQIQLDGGDHETPRFDCRWNILPFLLGLGSKCARRAPVVARPESVSRTWSARWHRPEPQRMRTLPTAGRLGLEQLCSPDRLFLL
jgi:hypothetical protein